MISQASSKLRGKTGKKKKPKKEITTAVQITDLVSNTNMKPSMIRLEIKLETRRRHLKRRVPSAITPSTPEPIIPNKRKRAPKREELSLGSGYS